MEKWHLIVKGRVQGVGFRYFTAQSARENNISGWVRNLPGGAVEIHGQGEEADLRLFLDAVKQGPSMSRVDGVDKETLPPDSSNGFSIR